MPAYTPPLADINFLLTHVLPLKHDMLDAPMIEAVLEEAGKLASGVLAPLNAAGDKQGAKLADGNVTTTPGWKEAYAAYRDGGWNAVPFTPEHGGQGLPWAMAFPLQEMWQSANMAFGLCPLLNQGAVEALTHYGTDTQKNLYLPKLISGEWTGTMNLTEPQAGSDLAAIRAKAEPIGDGTYRLYGQKIFITYGEHDLTPNILHLVLARLPDAPAGVKGISLFLVPKYLVAADDSLNARTDVTCTGLEHKMGIHGSPTCTMSYGDHGGAIGELVGAPHEGIKAMFTMMNNARLSVGLQGVAIAERAYQAALAYASERVQGRILADGTTAPILHHADISRMLLRMLTLTQTGRALAYQSASWLDEATNGDAEAQACVDLITPVVKGWCTEIAQEVTSLGVQVHGGMGYIEETGAAQYMRDARILPIYEGTNGIQANDLLFRKLLRDGGATLQKLLQSCEQVIQLLNTQSTGDDGESLAKQLTIAITDTKRAVEKILAQKDAHIQSASAFSTLQLISLTLGGWMQGRRLLFANAALSDGQSTPHIQQQMLLARFYADEILPQTTALAHTICAGGTATTAATVDIFRA